MIFWQGALGAPVGVNNEKDKFSDFVASQSNVTGSLEMRKP
jgi:hypothetical protein